MLQLVSVDLSGNQLSGSLPDSWSGMSALTHMNISSNGLNGPLPLSWSNLAQVFEHPMQCCVPALHLPRAITPLRRDCMQGCRSDSSSV